MTETDGLSGPVASRSRRGGFDWEAAGRDLGASLDTYHALVVIGADPVATGRVAVGIARAQALKRRVAVGDLFAESPPIQELIQTEDPHGLVDSFLYGVSLSRIAYPVSGSGQLFAMPSGTEPPDYREILPNPRWRRLVAGFREVGALLVLAVPASAPQIEDLVAATDGAILVGEAAPRNVPVPSVVCSVRATREPVAAPAEQVGGRKAPGRSKRQIAAIAGVGLAIVLAAIGLWLAYRPLAKGGRSTLGPKPDTTAKAPRAVASPVKMASRDSGADIAGPVPTITAPTVTNPADSAQAAAFAVLFVADNTQAGAILRLQQDDKNLPAATFAPVLVQGARWFKAIGGAYSNRADADALLAGLRRRNFPNADKGSVVRVPFAFLIDSGVPATAVPGMVQTYADRGQPVYALRQLDGSAWLLAGAFESPDQSALFAESLRASGIRPVLVYRKGRPF